MKKKLKLYVWTGFSPDWTGGLAFAIAASEKEARELVIKAIGYNPVDWGSLEERSVGFRFAAAVHGGS